MSKIWSDVSCMAIFGRRKPISSARLERATRLTTTDEAGARNRLGTERHPPVSAATMGFSPMR